MDPVKTDVLVVGAGSAGLRAALAAAEAGSMVLVLNKGPLGKSGISLVAGGGMQAPFHPDDNADLFFQDTINAGYGLGDQNLAAVLAEDACARVLDVERYGAKFARTADGQYFLSQFPGQSYPRQLSIVGGGLALVSALSIACKRHKNISIMDDFFMTGLLNHTESNLVSVTGAIGINLRTGYIVKIEAKAVIMATGGCQWLWEVNDCPADATGDGIVFAYRTGAELVDMEMVLFYPSVVIWPVSLRGAFVHYEYLASAIFDGNIYDRNGKPILSKPLPMRDEAMRMMNQAIMDGRGTVHGGLEWYIGDSPKEKNFIHTKLNTDQYNYIRANGIEPSTDRIQVAPGAHYLMGGIYINEQCETTVSGLFAVPECAGNFDGANRMAGNGLTATQVFGFKAGISAHRWAAAHSCRYPDKRSVDEEVERIMSKITAGNRIGAELFVLRHKLRSAVQRDLGVRRSAKGLAHLLSVTDEVQAELAIIRVPHVAVYNQQLMELLQLEVMCEISRLIAGSALLRQESRGHHFRFDFPERDDLHFLKHTRVVSAEKRAEFGSIPIKYNG
ncbi:MAG: nadB [Firmicutes bacterium]|nr:nadB [Bacillota bacterium]